MTDVSNSDDAAKAMDRRLEQLLILTLINSLRRHEDQDNDGASQDDLTATAAKEDMSLDDQAAISSELMIVAQRLIDAQLLDLRRDEDGETHIMLSLPAPKILRSSLSSMSSSPDQQLMRDDETGAIKKKSTASAKKKRYRKNKAVAKRRKKIGRMSWLWLGGDGNLPQIITMALCSITTLIVCLTIIHHSHSVDGSNEGGANPALPPTSSKSLLRRIAPTRRKRKRQHHEASAEATTTPSTRGVINSPSISDMRPPFFLPATSRIDSEDTSLFSSRQSQQTCFDTPNWKNDFDVGCYWYEINDVPGCPELGDEFTGDMGPATENCCHCGGGTATLPPTISPYPSSSPTDTEPCFDTPNWEDTYGEGCDYYEERDLPGCPGYSEWHTGDMGSALENCCYCGGGSATLPPTSTPTISASPTEFCLDTPNWKDNNGNGCDFYDEDDPGCPGWGDLFTGDMGPATEHCCYCGGGSATLPPTISPTISASPTLSSSPTEPPSPCLDTPNWKDYLDQGCDYYEEWDLPGCPYNGDSYTGDMGPASENCCHCGGGSSTLPPTISPYPSSSPTLSSSPTEFCLDTPNWKDKYDHGCDQYELRDDQECPTYGEIYEFGDSFIIDNTVDMGSALENCCYCGGGIRPTCEGYRSMCQNSFSVFGVRDGDLTELCRRADSCPCDGSTHEFQIVDSSDDDFVDFYTVGLYDECKCDYWLRLCEDTGEGVACDYSAEYCCGDYDDATNPKNSPACYCDFYNYAQNEFDHTLKPQTPRENIAYGRTQFNNPCTDSGMIGDVLVSLKAIYSNTNGQNWTNNAGWMNDPVPHCQWYGISCNDDGSVIGIDLRNNNLQGEFPVYTRSTDLWDNPIPESNGWLYTKYGLAQLFYLETLDLADNNLTGTIEYRPLYNLKSLHHFDISGNQLSGGFDPLITPSISYADFSNNRFTSMHRFQSFKVSPLQTLRSLDVSNNEIKIDASDLLRHIPQDIEQFVASNNDIHGKLPASLNNLPKLRRFDVSFNALSGELPVFENSRFVLQELDLSNQDQANGLTGPIPEELWRFQSLKILSLAGNKLTGIVLSDIVNLAVLKRFDMSNNHLSGEIPPQIGQLAGTLNYLGLANNTFSGIIPSELGDLRDASVLVRGDSFDANSTTPLSLCKLVKVKYSDLADDTTFCPMERNALSNFYDSAKGGEWTNGTNWNDEYTSPCDWHGVECDENKQVVTELKLRNNGLSGRLSSSIGSLTFLTQLDLSDNDIKGSIPIEIGLLTQLEYLRLSYNAFTGTAPDELADLTNLQLLQLQSNRITGMPNLPKLEFDKSIFGESTFVADCGVPSAFENALVCDNCTMCCNANEDCYPQEQTQIEELGLNYSSFAAIILVSFTLLYCMIIFVLSRFRKQQGSASTLTKSMQERKEDDDYALSRIGSDSVYSYFVTDLRLGWLCAFATLAVQAWILIFFVQASEVKLQDDKTDIEFTWKCPRDSDECNDKSDLEYVGWFSFYLLMVAFLAKDLINGSRLIYHSSKARHTFWERTRYFVGGLSLCSITVYALYVSIVYNGAIATSNTDIILNSVVVLFIMDMDQVIFAALGAINEKWIKHVNGSEDELKQKIVLQDSKIASQQEEMARLRDEMAFLREAVQELQEAQPTALTSTSESVHQCAVGASYNKASEAGETVSPSHNDNGVTIPFVDMEAGAEVEESPVAAATSIAINDFNDNTVLSFDFEKETR